MKIKELVVTTLSLLIAGCSSNIETIESSSDLVFNDLAISWDEAMPLGNGVVGALVWKKDSALRISLDRMDLWDLRPIDSISGNNNRFSWVYEQVEKGDYYPVQKKFDHPYSYLAAPSKIPGAALEFDIRSLGKEKNVRLYLKNGVCEVEWENGASMKSFVHATKPVGWFVFEGVGEDITPMLIPPLYNNGQDGSNQGEVNGQDLRRLGYSQGDVTSNGDIIVYHQKGWDDFSYDVVVKSQRKGDKIEGAWSITSSLSSDDAVQIVEEAFNESIGKQYKSHSKWWDEYNNASAVYLPEENLQRQYDNEMYKFGSSSRENGYIIPLQSVWTADNGRLPPWKGDVHHDLNTQLSYWPCYTGNHLKEGMGYLNTLWNQREKNKAYTKGYFGTDGLNVPGVATLTGDPMGGWIQYAMSPTISAWLGQHFYLNWKYSADEDFLRNMGYPYLKDVATHLEQFTIINNDGERVLPLSSSPEIYDNSINAWFKTMTNYDLALVKFAFKAASEMAEALGEKGEADHWKRLESELPAFDIDSTGGLTFAKGHPYNESHRHFSNAMAVHPLSLIDMSGTEQDREIVKATIANLDKYGSDWWTGYSYSWLGNMKARAFDGEGAAEALRTFADCFCLRNGFHVNGDQSGTGKSKFTYRPFTLEGNFAFASGIQEMLIQGHTGIVQLFPAIPVSWKDVGFDKLRTFGGFLVSAKFKDGELSNVEILPEKGGIIRIKDTFGLSKLKIKGAEDYKIEDGVLNIKTSAMKPVTISL